MTRLAGYTLALAALVTVTVTGARAGSMEDAFDRAAMNTNVDHANVLVNSGCSGTVVAPQMVLTAAHCVLDQFRDVKRDKIAADGKVKVETVRIAIPGTVTQLEHTKSVVTQTTSVTYKIVNIDRQTDLALLALDAPMGMIAAVSCHSPVRGETVFAVGNPFGVLYASLSKGIVGSTDRSYRDLQLAGQLGDETDPGDHALVQHTALIAPGNSGGALYDGAAKLVGVNVRGGSGFAFSVPLADVRVFLTLPDCK